MTSREKMTGRTVIVAMAVIVLPLIAEANAGTPMILGFSFHLILGNLLLGVVEGHLLARIKPERSVAACEWLMIGANYLSAWLGGVFLQGLTSPLYVWMGIEHLKIAFWCAVVIAYLFTLVIEAPFIWISFRGCDHRLARVVKASLYIQSVTYIALFGFYALISATSLFSVNVVDVGTMRLPDHLTVSFLGKDGKGYTGDPQRRDWKETDAADVMNRLADNASPDFNYYLETVGGTNSTWRARIGLWAGHGLRCVNEKTGQTFHLAIETPILMWTIRHATQLSDGKVLFQLGGDQICIADPEKNQVALLTRGKHPIAEVKTDR